MKKTMRANIVPRVVLSVLAILSVVLMVVGVSRLYMPRPELPSARSRPRIILNVRSENVRPPRHPERGGQKPPTIMPSRAWRPGACDHHVILSGASRRRA